MGSRCHRLLFASLSLCNKTNFSLLFFIFAPHWKNLRQAFAEFLPCVYTLHCTPWSKLYWEQETNWDTARQSSSMAMLCMAEQLSLHSLHDADTCTWCALGFYKCLKSFYSSPKGGKERRLARVQRCLNEHSNPGLPRNSNEKRAARTILTWPPCIRLIARVKYWVCFTPEVIDLGNSW